MQIYDKELSSLRPYKNNPRKNTDAVEYVQNSIEKFGFKVPIIIDRDGVIVCGHTRYKAALNIGLKTVPCIIADDLSDEQVKAFRLADNKTGEIAQWDFALLDQELTEIEDINMGDFGFSMEDSEFPEALNLDEENNTEKFSADKVFCPKCGFEFEV